MADSNGGDGAHPAMDYAEHERTYEGFLRFAMIGTIWCITIVVGLAIGGPGQSWGWGSFLIFLSTVAAAIGVFVKSIDAKGVIGVLVLSLLVFAWKGLH
jgi:small-conductance mechanosensitive channel